MFLAASHHWLSLQQSCRLTLIHCSSPPFHLSQLTSHPFLFPWHMSSVVLSFLLISFQLIHFIRSCAALAFIFHWLLLRRFAYCRLQLSWTRGCSRSLILFVLRVASATYLCESKIYSQAISRLLCSLRLRPFRCCSARVASRRFALCCHSSVCTHRNRARLYFAQLNSAPPILVIGVFVLQCTCDSPILSYPIRSYQSICLSLHSLP